MSVAIIRDSRFQEHNAGPHHPESPGRLAAIDRALDRARAEDGLTFEELPARMATDQELRLAHDDHYVDRLLATRGKSVMLDPDTHTSSGSVDAAVLAAGSTVEMFSRVARGETKNGLVLCRPPGHHARKNTAMGFCLFNNIAIAARALIRQGLAERICIYDWDVHHGNGTQEIFYDDPSVLYLSTHQSPFYPGTGSVYETGSGKGEGTTFNIPLPAGTDDSVLLSATTEAFTKKVASFRPDLVLISAGFDPYALDPIGGFQISIDGFYELARRWKDLADQHCAGRIAAVLEGGYHQQGLGDSVVALIRAWSR